MKIIALRGKNNVGKSTTLKLLIQKIFQNDAQLICCNLLMTNATETCDSEKMSAIMCVQNATCVNEDVYAIFDYRGYAIAITSVGDTPKCLESAFGKIRDSLSAAKSKTEPDIFICAIRSRGETYEYLKENFKYFPIIVYNKMSVHFINKNDDVDKEEMNKINELQATVLMEYIDKLVLGGK